MTIDIRPIDPIAHPEFVGLVAGIDLSRPARPKEIAAIAAGMDRYAVLVFRDQRIDDAQQLAFSRNFGPLEQANADIRRPEDRRLGQEVADISVAYKLLSPLLGTTLASTLFAVTLLCSGQNATLTQKGTVNVEQSGNRQAEPSKSARVGGLGRGHRGAGCLRARRSRECTGTHHLDEQRWQCDGRPSGSQKRPRSTYRDQYGGPSLSEPVTSGTSTSCRRSRSALSNASPDRRSNQRAVDQHERYRHAS